MRLGKVFPRWRKQQRKRKERKDANRKHAYKKEEKKKLKRARENKYGAGKPACMHQNILYQKFSDKNSCIKMLMLLDDIIYQ